MPDDTPLTDEQRALAGDPKHVKMALDTADVFAYRSGGERESFRAEALYGLVCAARGYKPEDGKFSTFAQHRIRGAVLDYARKESHRGFSIGRGAAKGGLLPQSISADHAIGHGADGPIVVADIIPSGELSIGWELESEDAVCTFASHLPFRFAEAIRRAFLDCETPTLPAACRSLGLHGSYLGTRLYEHFGEVRGK